MKEFTSARSSILRFAFICAASFLSTGANAQSQSPAAAGDVALEEIVVTAQRRETDLQRTALAASVLSGQDLVDQGVTDLVALVL